MQVPETGSGCPYQNVAPRRADPSTGSSSEHPSYDEAGHGPSGLESGGRHEGQPTFLQWPGWAVVKPAMFPIPPWYALLWYGQQAPS